VVGTEAWVDPPLGASWTPGAFEPPPQAASAVAAAKPAAARAILEVIERGRLAKAPTATL